MGTMTRRQLLELAGVGMAALAAAPAQAAERHFAGPFGVQMYSIRDGMQSDPAAALRMVRRIGYDEIEAWQPNGVNARQLKPLLAAAGLRATSMHTVYAELDGKIDGLIANAHELGAGWIVCAWVDAKLRRSADDYRKLADKFNGFGERLRRAGLRLGYHNHTEEFEKFDGRPGLDLLIEGSDPERLWFELDIGHARRAGARPAEYLRRYPRRIKLLHLKDVAPKPGVDPSTADDYQDVPMGTGVIDLPAVLRQAAANRVERYYVEEEVGDVRRRLTTDYQFLRRVAL